jgi:hypothetical protein
MKTHIDDQVKATPKTLLKPGKQWIGLEHLTWDEAVQPRAAVDRAWASELTGFLKEGSAFPPIDVFQLEDGTLLPASGHHRAIATGSAGESQILCEVRNGTREDAIVFAAGSNKSNGVKPMGPKDVTKAVEMLFSIEGWWEKTDNQIADHAGTSKAKVRKIRDRINERDGRKLPDFVFTIHKKKIKRVPYNHACKPDPEPRIFGYGQELEGLVRFCRDSSDRQKLLAVSLVWKTWAEKLEELISRKFGEDAND